MWLIILDLVIYALISLWAVLQTRKMMKGSGTQLTPLASLLAIVCLTAAFWALGELTQLISSKWGEVGVTIPAALTALLVVFQIFGIRNADGMLRNLILQIGASWMFLIPGAAMAERVVGDGSMATFDLSVVKSAGAYIAIGLLLTLGSIIVNAVVGAISVAVRRPKKAKRQRIRRTRGKILVAPVVALVLAIAAIPVVVVEIVKIVNIFS